MKQFMSKISGQIVASMAITMVCVLVCTVVFTCCGGGAKKSGLKQNELLGNLPAIHADYALTETSFKEKADKVTKSGNFKKMVEAAAKEAKASAERYAKYDAATTAEWKKIDGKTIPFSRSDAFEQLNIEVESVTLNAEQKGAIVVIHAKQDFTVTDKNRKDYEQFYYRVLAEDGTEIDTYGIYLLSMFFKYSVSLTQGQNITFTDSPLCAVLRVTSKPEAWVNFANIEFITYDEYMKK
jgi:hypothetical protein